MIEPLIDMQAVSLYRKDRYLLKDLSWKVLPNQNWAILGLNGAGKSTLLRLLIAEYWKTSGNLSVLGIEFGKGDIPSLRQQIGIVGSFMAERLPSHMYAEQVVLTGKYKSSILYKEYGTSELDEAKNMLIKLDGEKLIGRPYNTLSQGEKQILLIARALMEQPRLLILDEATSGLDLLAREKLLKQIQNISKLKQAPTIIYITHHAEEISDFISHILLLKNGQIISQGTKNKILQPEILTNFYGHQVDLIPLDNNEQRYFIKPLI